MKRIDLEKDTLAAMIRIYCKGQKHKSPLCGECQKLLTYAAGRLEACKFGESKTFCSKCPVHCYKPDMRESIKTVMRYSGPRMLWHNPVMVVRHLVQK